MLTEPLLLPLLLPLKLLISQSNLKGSNQGSSSVVPWQCIPDDGCT
jgi:hypothetical protein